MSGSLRWWAALSLGVLALVGAPVLGRPRPVPAPSPRQPGYQPSTFAPAFNSNPLIAPGLSLQQAKYNTAQLGGTQTQLLQSMGLTGKNLAVPLAAAALGSGALFGGGGYGGGYGGGGYGLSSVAGGNPYLGGAASLGASPYGSGYSLSTTGGSGYGGYGGYGFPPGDGATLMGVAGYTDASGKYWINIQQARLMREQSRQAVFETQRKEIEFLRWWDSVRPTAPKMRDQEMATDLDRARKDPPSTEVWSGKSLNDLLRSVQRASARLNRGPNLELSEDTLKHINLTDSSASGNIGMLKDGGELSWPLPLRKQMFEKAQKQLSKTLPRLVDQVKNKEEVSQALLKDVNSDYKSLNDTLAANAEDLTPSEYIEAKRYLNQLKGALRVLSAPNASRYFNNTWNAKGKNVAELVSFLNKEGLQFAPAAPGDEAAYNALFLALRSFESGVQTANR